MMMQLTHTIETSNTSVVLYYDHWNVANMCSSCNCL